MKENNKEEKKMFKIKEILAIIDRDGELSLDYDLVANMIGKKDMAISTIYHDAKVAFWQYDIGIEKHRDMLILRKRARSK